MIMKCNCKDDYQDRKHGRGKRVHNLMKLTVEGQKARCARCGDIKHVEKGQS